MPDTTLEEAKRCPRCQNPGVQTGSKPAAERWMGTIYTFSCKSKLCKMYNDIWFVQVRPDGTIPSANEHHERNFPVREGMSTRARIAKARADLDAQIKEEKTRR